MTIKPTPLAALVEDLSLYPRHAVDDTHVGNLVQALRAGATFPPIVADAASKRLVDGWHRVRAYRRVLGAEGVIDVDLRKYGSEAEVLLDAIRLNASHGRKFDRIDQVRSVLLADGVGIPVDQLSFAMQVTTERIQTLRIRVALAPAPGDGTVTGTLKVALKRSMGHFADQQMTAEQVAAHDSQAGTSFLLQVHQLRDALRYDLMNRADARLMAALDELIDELGRYRAPLAKSA